MSLISRLGRQFREKPKQTDLNLPSLPTPREILEDIEACPSTDPILNFAMIIQKKGKQSLLDGKFLEDTSTSSLSPKLAFLAPYQITPTDKAPEDTHAKAPPSKGKGGHTSSKHKKIHTEEEQINDYNKLKQFMLVYEKSEELLANMEPHFKQVDIVLKDCDEFCAKSKAIATVVSENDNSHSHFREVVETDVCSSPLL